MPIRVATPADIEPMHRIRMSVRENALADPSRVTPAHYEEMLARRGRGWVHEEGGEIVGFAIADNAARNVWALFVAPGHEGRGIGRGIFAALVEWLFAQDSRPVWLSTDPGTRAERLYRAAGWREAGRSAHGEVRFERHAADHAGATR